MEMPGNMKVEGNCRVVFGGDLMTGAAELRVMTAILWKGAIVFAIRTIGPSIERKCSAGPSGSHETTWV